MIDSLKPNEIFVFGSNLMGNHAGGAAKQAKEQFDAVEGVGEGLTGQCYAFPTLDENMRRFDATELTSIRAAFLRCVNAHPELTFLVTKVGCGIAGYNQDQMRELFRVMPDNVIKPKGW